MASDDWTIDKILDEAAKYTAADLAKEIAATEARLKRLRALKAVVEPEAEPKPRVRQKAAAAAE